MYYYNKFNYYKKSFVELFLSKILLSQNNVANAHTFCDKRVS